MPSLHSRLLTIGALVASMAIAFEAKAQTDYTWTGADGAYDDNGNWDFGFPPDGSFDERAIINTGTARVGNTVLQPAQVTLGGEAGMTGTMVIQNGGNLTVYNGEFAPDNVSSGGIDVGVGTGTGALVVQPGGTLNAGYIVVLGENSSVTLDGSGASPATVFIENIPGKNSGTNVHPGRSLRVIGPNVDYTTNNFDLEPGSTFISEITGATHSTIYAPNGVFADGILRVEFDGYVPNSNDTWTLFDTTSVTNSFSAIEAPGVALPQGQKFTFRSEANGSSTHGTLGVLSIEQRLVLKVNRGTGLMSIETGTESVDFDGYSITSNLGGIDPTKWNSLDDQNTFGDWRESPSPGTQNAVAELKPTSATTVTSGIPLNLGNLFDKPLATEFGTQELEDIQFEYYTPDGQTIQADVIYEGEKQYNNLVLVVDPVDGDAVLQNQSNLSVSIDGYNIHSDSGSLLPNNGDWLSLEDQGASTWRESGESASDLSELLPSGAALVAGGAMLNLGSPFNTVSNGGTEDLVFRYLLPGESEFSDGVVVYRDVTFTPLVGDYNGNGTVDAADYTVWRDTLNSSVPMGTGADGNGNGVIDANDYQLWKSNFGMTSSPGAAAVTTSAVPEPNSLLLFAMTICATVYQRLRLCGQCAAF